METVGGYLKKERESKNISLRELSRLTKISELYLEYIEKDEFDKLPQGPYAKGYIASYSRLIGSNADEAIALYEALNKKAIPAEDAPPDIPDRNGKKDLPEKPFRTERKKPIGPRLEKARSFFNSVVSSIPIDRFSFKAATTSIRNIGSPIRIGRRGLDPVVSFLKRVVLSRSWLYAVIMLVGIAILLLAGFGFYHLFIYEPTLSSVTERDHTQQKGKPPLPAIGAEKQVLPAPSTGASSTAERPEANANHSQRPQAATGPEAKKQPAASSTDPSEALPRAKAEGQTSSGESDSASPTGAALSGSSSAEAITGSSPTSDGAESPERSGQNGMTAGSPSTSTGAEADLTVLQASVCAEIKDRMPAGVATSFPTSAERVFVWSEIEAKQFPSEIRHIYYFNDEIISDVTLDVGSAYWRTWSAKSISEDRYRGEWRVDIATAGGQVLRRLYFKVR